MTQLIGLRAVSIKLLVVVAILGFSAPHLLAQSSERSQAASATASQAAEARAEQLTNALLRLNEQYRVAAPSNKSTLLNELAMVAAERRDLLSALVLTNPAAVLKVSLPENIRAGLAAPVQASSEQTFSARGVLKILYADYGSAGTGLTHGKLSYHLQTASERLSLHFAFKPPTHLLTGATVRVHGTRIGNSVVLACCNTGNTSSLQTVTAATLPNTFGNFNTLVMLCNFLDNTAQPVSVAQASSQMSSVSNYDMENSYQQTWLTPDVVGWYTLPENYASATSSNVESYCNAAAQNAGVNLSNYSRFMYVIPGLPNTGWWGLAEVGGQHSWVQAQYGFVLAVTAHEMGHNFGLYHAHSLSCGTNVLCSSGSLSEYGDNFDMMGNNPNYNGGHFNAFQKERLGWLNYSSQPPITTVSASGTYQLSPYEAQDSGPKALKILQSGSSNSYYYVELRQALGFDSYLSSNSNLLNGVLFHFASPSSGNSSDLLNMTPGGSWNSPALDVGKSYTDSTIGVTFTPVSVSNTGASIQVTFSAAACTSANPTVSLSPLQSQSVSAGTPVNFTVTVKDNDSSACAPSTFSLGNSLLSGWTGVWNTSLLTLSPGTSGSATLTVTSPSGTASGLYNVGVSAANTAAMSYAASASATYAVASSAPLTVSVTTNQSTYAPGQMVSISVSVLSGTSAAAGVSLGVTVSAPNGRATSMTGTTGSNGIALFNYKLKRNAAAGTYPVRANTNATGNSSTLGSTTSFLVQ